MITIISGTNRAGSLTLRYANAFANLLSELDQPAQLLDLAELDHGVFSNIMYDPERMSPALKKLQRQYILEADKLVMFVPEYNGSFPGVLKLFIDGISVNDYDKNFTDSTTAVVGISTGRAGNSRGVDHLADILNHMGGWVLPLRLPISLANKHIDANGTLSESTAKALNDLATQLIKA